MRNWIIVVILFFCCIQLNAQNLKLDAGKIAQKEFLEEIPFELEFGKIILPVRINGQTYRFLLDTGAPNIISKKIADVINPDFKKDINVVDANNQRQNMELVPIPELQLGSLRYVNGVAIVVDLDNHPILKCFRLDGFIGSNFFKNVVLQVDYAAKKIRISPTIKSFAPNSKGQPMKLIGPQLAPYITITYPNEIKIITDQALLDTGMDGFYDLSSRAYKLFNAESDSVINTIASSTGVGALGLFEKLGPTPHWMVEIPKVKLSETLFTHAQVITTDDENSRIGLKAFEYGKVTLDFNKKKWYYEAGSSADLTTKPKQLSPTFIDEKLVVGIVWEESLQSKLQFGNKIVKINHQSIESLSVCELLKMKEILNENSSYVLEIINNSGETVIINNSK